MTDADVVLGKIDPSRFSGGVELDTRAATEAIEARIGAGLGLDGDFAAFAIGEIVDENMASAARVHAIESGKAVGPRTMIAFGGAAPIHAAQIARKLGVSRVLVPANAGVGSAVGFLAAGLAFEQARSLFMPLAAFDAARVNAVLEDMARSARALLGDGTFDVTRLAYMRYAGQGHEITVDVPTDTLGLDAAAGLKAAFEARYEALFGRIIPGLAVEALTWTVRVKRRDAPTAAVIDPAPASSDTGQRRLSVFDPVVGGRMDYLVLDRASLAAGEKVSGPCLVTEPQTTTVVPSDYRAERLADGGLMLTRDEATA